MQTLHLKTNELAMAKILSFIDSLAQKGEEIELLDNKTFAYEKRQIDKALKEVADGKLYSIEEVEKELLYAG